MKLTNYFGYAAELKMSLIRNSYFLRKLLLTKSSFKRIAESWVLLNTKNDLTTLSVKDLSDETNVVYWNKL